MSDATAKTIRSLALAAAAMGEGACGHELPDGTRILVFAAQALNPGEALPLPPALPTVAANCKNPKPYPIYFPRPGILNLGAARQDCTHGKVTMNNLITPR